MPPRCTEHVAHVQFAADLLHVIGLALVGEGGVARDHERASDAREIGGKALGYAIDKIFLLGVAADIGEGQNNDGQTRCCGRGRNLRQPWGGLRGHRPADFEQIGPDRLGDVLELDWAKIIDRKIEPGSYLAISVFGEADTVRLRDAFQPRSDVDAVAIDAAFIVDDIADIDANAELHAPFWLNRSVALCHFGLDSDRASDRVHHAGKFGENAIAGGVDDAPAEFANHWKHHCLMPLEVTHRARLVRAHQRAITGDVRGQDGGEPARLALRHSSPPLSRGVS